jgi:Protein of unknown function (DUF4239)
LYDNWIAWVYTLSNFGVAISFILSMLFLGVFGLIIFKFYFGEKFQLGFETNEAIVFFAQSIGVAYGILIGLTAVACWDNFEEAQRIIAKESGSIAQFHRLTYGIESPQMETVRQANLEYLKLIESDEMPALREGITCDQALGAQRALRMALYAFMPKNPRDQTFYADLLSDYNQMVGLRQERVARALDYAVPSVFWIVILVGGLVTMFMIFFIHMPSKLVHYVLMSSYCLVMGLMYFLIAVIDHPFKGEIHVSSEPYRQVQRELAAGL